MRGNLKVDGSPKIMYVPSCLMGCSIPESGDNGDHIAQCLPTSSGSTYTHITRG